MHLRLAVGGSHALVLDADAGFGRIDLRLEHPSLESPALLGWEGRTEHRPDVLRRQELREVCRYLGARVPELAHPVAYLLLYRFAPLTDDDDPQSVGRETADALEQLGLFTRAQAAEVWETTEYERDGAAWAWDERRRGWTLRGTNTGLSLRVATNDRFPFAQLEDVMETVREGFQTT